MKEKIKKIVSAFFFSEADKQTLALLRIGLASLMLVEAVSILPDVSELFGQSGLLDSQLMKALGIQLLPNLHFLWKEIPFEFGTILKSVFYLYCFSLVILLVGFSTRFATISVWLTQAFLMNCSYLGVYGVDRYFQLIIFLAVFSPWGEKLSVDSYRHKSETSAKVHFFWHRTMQIAIAMTYANAGIAKSLGTDWWDGTAVWRAIHLPEFQQIDLIWLGSWPLLFKILGWATLLFESTFPLVLLSKRFRWIAVPAMVGMHIGIGLFLGLHLFAVTMILFDILLFLVPDILARRQTLPAIKSKTFFGGRPMTAFPS